MNYKRRKSRSRVRCTLCTPNRFGNSKSRQKIQDKKADITGMEFVEDVLARVR